MKKVLVSLLVLAVLLTGCVSAETAPHLENGQTVGKGGTSFALTIIDGEGKRTDVTVQTDEETVGAALVGLHIVSGEQGEYGLYIKTVNGITADYDKDGTYWAFYVNGEYAEASADLTPIEPDTVYTLQVEAA